MQFPEFEFEALPESQVPPLQVWPWTKEEDEILLEHVKVHGTRKWKELVDSGKLPKRNTKACCNRYRRLKLGQVSVAEARLMGFGLDPLHARSSTSHASTSQSLLEEALGLCTRALASSTSHSSSQAPGEGPLVHHPSAAYPTSLRAAGPASAMQRDVRDSAPHGLLSRGASTASDQESMLSLTRRALTQLASAHGRGGHLEGLQTRQGEQGGVVQDGQVPPHAVGWRAGGSGASGPGAGGSGASGSFAALLRGSSELRQLEEQLGRLCRADAQAPRATAQGSAGTECGVGSHCSVDAATLRAPGLTVRNDSPPHRRRLEVEDLEELLATRPSARTEALPQADRGAGDQGDFQAGGRNAGHEGRPPSLGSLHMLAERLTVPAVLRATDREQDNLGTTGMPRQAYDGSRQEAEDKQALASPHEVSQFLELLLALRRDLSQQNQQQQHQQQQLQKVQGPQDAQSLLRPQEDSKLAAPLLQKEEVGNSKDDTLRQLQAQGSWGCIEDAKKGTPDQRGPGKGGAPATTDPVQMQALYDLWQMDDFPEESEESMHLPGQSDGRMARWEAQKTENEAVSHTAPLEVERQPISALDQGLSKAADLSAASFAELLAAMHPAADAQGQESNARLDHALQGMPQSALPDARGQSDHRVPTPHALRDMGQTSQKMELDTVRLCSGGSEGLDVLLHQRTKGQDDLLPQHLLDFWAAMERDTDECTITVTEGGISVAVGAPCAAQMSNDRMASRADPSGRNTPPAARAFPKSASESASYTQMLPASSSTFLTGQNVLHPYLDSTLPAVRRDVPLQLPHRYGTELLENRYLRFVPTGPRSFVKAATVGPQRSSASTSLEAPAVRARFSTAPRLTGPAFHSPSMSRFFPGQAALGAGPPTDGASFAVSSGAHAEDSSVGMSPASGCRTLTPPPASGIHPVSPARRRSPDMSPPLSRKRKLGPQGAGSPSNAITCGVEDFDSGWSSSHSD